ncbi:MAG: universal stress protein, partial [Desulfobacterales bacterium]
MAFFENILLFYNDQFSGIKAKVIQLLRNHRARLKIIDVFDNLDQYGELLPTSSSIEELKEVIITERRQEIIGHFEAYPDIRSQMTIIFKFGNTVVEIIKEVLLGGHDLVIKAASGEKTFRDHLFGNIAVKLLRKCPCPVLIVKPSERLSFAKILAPVDPETEGNKTSRTVEHINLICRKIINISMVMAQMENSHLDILYSWSLPGETLLKSGRTNIDPDALNRIMMLA